MRVSQCCCGCSLRTGTLILLWLSVFGSTLSILRGLGGSAKNDAAQAFNYTILASYVLELIFAAVALWGINEKKPGHMMPYIVFSAFIIISTGLFTLILVFASSVIINSGIIENLIESGQIKTTSNTYGSGRSYGSDHSGSSYGISSADSATVAKTAAMTLIFIIAFILVIFMALRAYFTVVIYSYYKTLQEQIKGAGVIYAMPPEQGNSNLTGGAPYNYPATYGQQQPSSYPATYGQQQPASYPPSYGHPQPVMYPQVPDQKV